MDQSQDPGVATLVDSPARTPARRPSSKGGAVIPTTPAEMLGLAVKQGASVEQLDKLITLMERTKAIDAKQRFVEAMVEFRNLQLKVSTNQTGTVRGKDGKEGYSYRYADLANINEAVTAGLCRVGISHNWTTRQENGLVYVTCTLTHQAGHSESTTLAASPDASGGKNSIQAIGSAVSYLRRYTLLAITGIAIEGDDDDGAGATGEEREQLRQEASKMREGRQRPDPQAIAGRNQVQQAGQALVDEARDKADKGHKEFGAYWRGLTDAQRQQLGPMLQDLSDRASAATAQRASEAGK